MVVGALIANKTSTSPTVACSPTRFVVAEVPLTATEKVGRTRKIKDTRDLAEKVAARRATSERVGSDRRGLSLRRFRQSN